jgi:hypothetical protein
MSKSWLLVTFVGDHHAMKVYLRIDRNFCFVHEEIECFDWFKKLRLFSNVRNLKIYVVLKASRAVVIRWFSLNEAPLELFKFIFDYLPYFEKINIFFNIRRSPCYESLFKDWSQFLFRSWRNNLNQVVHTE